MVPFKCLSYIPKIYLETLVIAKFVFSRKWFLKSSSYFITLALEMLLSLDYLKLEVTFHIIKFISLGCAN